MDELKIDISRQYLKDSGFTESGIDRYDKTLKEYNKLLYDKSISFGELDRAQGLNREVTHEHVKQAAYSIANSYGKPTKPRWLILIQIGIYLSAGFVGLSTGHLDKTEGVIGFAISFAAGAIFFIIDKTYSNK